MTRTACFTVTLTGLLLASCLHLHHGRVEDVYFRAGQPERGTYSRLELAEVTVEKSLDETVLRRNAGYIFGLLDARYARERTISGSYLAVVSLKEDSILCDLETLNSVTLEIRLTRADAEEPEVLYLFSEETARSISSNAYLYELIERAFRRIFP
jgi:hypothetical protein